MAELPVIIPATKLKSLENFFALKSFHLPKVPSKLPVQCHSDFLSLGREADEWLFDRMKIIDPHKKKDLVQWRIPLFNNMMIPYGTHEKALLCSKYTWAITVLDDPLDDEEKTKSETDERLDSIISILLGKARGKTASHDLAMKAWEEVILQVRSSMPPAVYKRFVDAHESWAGSFKMLSQISADNYIPFRRINIGYDPWFPMLEFCLEICLDEKDLQSPDYLATKTALIDHVWLVNDLYSIGKDFSFQQLRNLPFVLLLSDPAVATFQEAINRICKMISDKEEEYVYYHNILVAKAKHSNKLDFLRYMEVLRGMIHSNLLYHSLTARYHGADNPLLTGDVLHGTWLIDHLKHTSMTEKDIANPGQFANLLKV